MSTTAGPPTTPAEPRRPPPGEMPPEIRRARPTPGRLLFAGVVLLLELPILVPLAVGALISRIIYGLSRLWRRLRRAR